MSDPPIDEQDHLWFMRRLDSYALGLLDESEERRFLAHAGACASCGDALRSYQENVARIAREGHIPARLLARWDRASRRLRGMARRMVREHLESCAECRQDLEAVGFRPELEIVEELEGEPDPGIEDAPAAPTRSGDPRPATPAPAREIRLVMPARRPWASWWIGGATGAALATAATLLVVSGLPGRPALDVGTGPAATMPPERRPPAVAGPPVFEVLPPPIALQGPHRGPAAEDVPTLRLGPGARFVQLALPDLFLADSVSLDLRVLGPDGATLLSMRSQYAELGAGRTLLFGDPAADLPAGRYHLLVSEPSQGESVLGEYAFDLAR